MIMRSVISRNLSILSFKGRLFNNLHTAFCNFSANFRDPNDRSLRKVEKDVLIPQIIRDRTKTEKCVNEVKDFNECCKNSGLMLVLRCKKENEKMKECMKEWYFNEVFVKECTEQYLNERSEYRNTGIPKKQRNAKLHTTL